MEDILACVPRDGILFIILVTDEDNYTRRDGNYTYKSDICDVIGYGNNRIGGIFDGFWVIEIE